MILFQSSIFLKMLILKLSWKKINAIIRKKSPFLKLLCFLNIFILGIQSGKYKEYRCQFFCKYPCQEFNV